MDSKPRPPSFALYSRRRRWSAADAQAALRALAASRLSVRAFAEREGLDAQRLFRWQRRLGRAGAAARIAETSVLAPTATVPELLELSTLARPARVEPVEVVLPSGVTLRVDASIDPVTLARLVSALGRGC